MTTCANNSNGTGPERSRPYTALDVEDLETVVSIAFEELRARRCPLAEPLHERGTRARLAAAVFKFANAGERDRGKLVVRI